MKPELVMKSTVPVIMAGEIHGGTSATLSRIDSGTFSRNHRDLRPRRLHGAQEQDRAGLHAGQRLRSPRRWADLWVLRIGGRLRDRGGGGRGGAWDGPATE